MLIIGRQRLNPSMERPTPRIQVEIGWSKMLDLLQNAIQQQLLVFLDTMRPYTGPACCTMSPNHRTSLFGPLFAQPCLSVGARVGTSDLPPNGL